MNGFSSFLTMKTAKIWATKIYYRYFERGTEQMAQPAFVSNEKDTKKCNKKLKKCRGKCKNISYFFKKV